MYNLFQVLIVYISSKKYSSEIDSIFNLQVNMWDKNHVVVMPDASVDATVNALVATGFGAAGQRCMCQFV